MKAVKSLCIVLVYVLALLSDYVVATKGYMISWSLCYHRGDDGHLSLLGCCAVSAGTQPNT